jgi:hypothetical protein
MLFKLQNSLTPVDLDVAIQLQAPATLRLLVVPTLPRMSEQDCVALFPHSNPSKLSKHKLQ